MHNTCSNIFNVININCKSQDKYVGLQACKCILVYCLIKLKYASDKRFNKKITYCGYVERKNTPTHSLFQHYTKVRMLRKVQ